MTLTKHSNISRNPDIVSSEFDDEMVMMDTEFKNYFGMEAVGTRIWQILDEEISVAALCEKLTQEFEISEQQCLSELLVFLNELAKNQLVFVR